MSRFEGDGWSVSEVRSVIMGVGLTLRGICAKECGRGGRLEGVLVGGDQ